jgi:hypothetical protein
MALKAMDLFFFVDVELLLDRVGEIFLFANGIFPVHLVPLLIVTKYLLEVCQHYVHDVDCLASINYVCHRSLLGTHQAGTKTYSQIVGTHLAVLFVRNHILQQELNQKSHS